MRDRSIPRPVGRRILLLVAALFAGAVVWLTIHKQLPPATTPPAAPAETAAQPPKKVQPPAETKKEILARPTPLDDEPAKPADPPPSVKDLGGGRFRVGTIEFDENKRTISIPASVHMREGPVEYILVSKHGKIHESVFVTHADARNIHLAALLLGMKKHPDLGPAGAAVEIGGEGAVEAWVEWERNGPPAKVPLNETVALADPESGARSGTLPAGPWLYNGSELTPNGTFLASKSGSVISIVRDPEALINNPGASRDNDDIHTPNAARLPKLQHPVKIVLKVR
jgi:hypothetical protein